MLITLLLFVLHAIEEYFFGFQYNDLSTQIAASFFNVSPTVVFIGVQVIVIAILVFSIFLSNGWQTVFRYLVGVMILFELTHSLAAINSHQYSPGLITSLLLLTWGLFFFSSL